MNARTISKAYGRRGSTALLCALLGCWSAAPALAADCSSAAIAEPFALPDGRSFESGTLSLCLERVHSPVAALYEARVDGLPIGVYLTHGSSADDEAFAAGSPYLVFDRAPGGLLLLRGFVHGGRGGATLNAFVDPRVRIRVELGDSFLRAAHSTGDAVWIEARRG